MCSSDLKSSTPGVCRVKIKEAIKTIMSKKEPDLHKLVADFKKEFYDLTGTLTYLSVVWFTYLLSNPAGELKIGNLILALLISIWAVRLGSFLFLRIHKAGEDKRFRTIKPSASQFFMTWTLQGFWVSICSMCALTAISSEIGVITNIFFYIGFILFFIGFNIEIIADSQKNTFRSLEENKITVKMDSKGKEIGRAHV